MGEKLQIRLLLRKNFATSWATKKSSMGLYYLNFSIYEKNEHIEKLFRPITHTLHVFQLIVMR